MHEVLGSIFNTIPPKKCSFSFNPVVPSPKKEIIKETIKDHAKLETSTTNKRGIVKHVTECS
jgi:hypothetical protein